MAAALNGGGLALRPPEVGASLQHGDTLRLPSVTPLRSLSGPCCLEFLGPRCRTATDGAVDARVGTRRRVFTGAGVLLSLSLALSSPAEAAPPIGAPATRPNFVELEGSGGVRALDIRLGTGAQPQLGQKVAIHYYARLAAKQGWRFDNTYEHLDSDGVPEPYVFTVGSGEVIAGLDTAVRSMREGGVRRVVIPSAQGYLNTTQGPIPPNFSDRRRLYSTIFNPTRIANGEGSTLGTLIFDIELLRIRS